MKKIKITVSALLFILALALLIFFPELMLNSTGNIPLGTFIAWFVLVFYASFWYYMLPDYLNSGRMRFLKGYKNIYFLCALSWGFVSALLAGNWQFSFKNIPFRFELWIVFTVVILLFPILILFLIFIQQLFHKKNS